MDHTAFSRKGGKARSEAKTIANRAKASAFWAAVRSGEKPPPRRLRAPPSLETIAGLLATYCGRNDVTRLEAFGPIARGNAKRGTRVDLLVTFAASPGPRFFAMEGEMAGILRVPVHLLMRDAVERMADPDQRESILADATMIYHGQTRA